MLLNLTCRTTRGRVCKRIVHGDAIRARNLRGRIDRARRPILQNEKKMNRSKQERHECQD